MKACVITMQKDERLLLRHFATYYGYLFGFENLYILDNGSAAETRIILDDIARHGGNIIYSYSRPKDFELKGVAICNIANGLLKKYDVFITLDCDEFIGVKTNTIGNEYSCTKESIYNELSHFEPNTGYQVIERFRNNPSNQKLFYNLNSTNRKLVFGAGRIKGLSVGLHHCVIPKKILTSKLVFFEFHNKPFLDLQRSAKEKLKLRVDINDRNKLASYRGPGEHLPKYLLCSEEQYYEDVNKQPYLYICAINDAFNHPGLPPAFEGK